MPHLEDHYRELREQQAYDTVDFDLGPLPAAQLQRKFAAVDGHDTVAAALERPTIISTGIGMTGPPHMGSLGQILTAITLQEAGLNVQFVLADLEVYHGGGELDELHDPPNAIVHPQPGIRPREGDAANPRGSAGRDAQRTATRYHTPDEAQNWPDVEPTQWEQTLREAYKSDSDGDEEQGPTSEAGDLHSALLHTADFLHPLMKWEYEQVIITLGIDEHKLTVGTRRFRKDAGVDGTIAGLHTKLIKGVNGYRRCRRVSPNQHLAADFAELAT